MHTLSDFVDEQIEKYVLQTKNTPYEETFAKIRIKAQRELQKLGYWQTAKTKVIGKAKTRLFTEEQLQELATVMKPYFEKQAAKAIQADYQTLLENTSIAEDYTLFTPEDKDYKLTKNSSRRDPYEITKKELEKKANAIMLKALFELFYTPLNYKKLENTMYTLKLSDEPFKLAEAKHILEHPEGILYKKKDQS